MIFFFIIIIVLNISVAIYVRIGEPVNVEEEKVIKDVEPKTIVETKVSNPNSDQEKNYATADHQDQVFVWSNILFSSLKLWQRPLFSFWKMRHRFCRKIRLILLPRMRSAKCDQGSISMMWRFSCALFVCWSVCQASCFRALMYLNFNLGRCRKFFLWKTCDLNYLC